ncbi:adhesion G-protein coupled receptor G5 [Betta splendens]|uniref:Adhesion G-protein coupled receptor G5 n=1 Tax=Betta splendens TaxID=158456 RepID=A0A6P7LPA1_BETSP|nr:adhesion G-protein coupled receptor G5 [Betta splendens]
MDTKLLLVFVKLLLLFGLKAHTDGDQTFIQYIENTLYIGINCTCVHPSGYNIKITVQDNETAVICQKELHDHRVQIILPQTNFSSITLGNFFDHDLVVLLDIQSRHYQCVSTTRTGYCWKKGDNFTTPEIPCNDISSAPSLCKSFTGDRSLTFDSTGCNTCQPVDLGNSNALQSTLNNLITSYKDKLINTTAVNITAGNITGVLIQLQNASNINVGITRSGATKILQSNADTAGLFVSVEIPAEATTAAERQNSSVAAVVLFPHIERPRNSSVYFNNTMLAIEMEANISNLIQPVKVHFNDVDKKGGNASCVSWNGEAGSNWTGDGCDLVELNGSSTCECHHLTFFALLISTPQSIGASDYTSLSYLTSVGCGLSMLFLAVGLFMHGLIRRGKASRAVRVLMQLFVAMFLLDLCFLVNESVAGLGSAGACVAAAAAMHYAMLATVSWFLVQALHLYYNMWRSPDAVSHYLVRLSALGWGTPAVVVLLMLIMQKYGLQVLDVEGGSAAKLCWIPDAAVQQGVNVGYYAVVFVLTLAVFVATVRQLLLLQTRAEEPQRRSIGSRVASVLGLLLLLGVTWAVAFFSYGPLLVPSYYIFTILNSFQGFFLFIYYYRSSRIIVDDRRLKEKSGSTCSSQTAVTPHI